MKPLPRLLVAIALLTLAGCATNPVTGQQDLVLMSEEQELALGRKANADVLKEYGRYDNPTLQEYVQRVGRELAAKSHRDNIIYRFTVLDSPEVNAFALPGGYIYITRGILAYLNSEAELAAVLGHEIGHVTARHGVRQQTAQTVTGLLGAIIAAGSGVQGASEVTNVLGAAITSGYGREHELEADRLGAEYLARVGFNPEEMRNVIGVLKNQELFERTRAKQEGREPKIYHGVFATHPDNDQRLAEVVQAASRLGEKEWRDPGQLPYLKQIDGITFGPSAREGVTRENRFLHRDLDIAIDFPAGWRLENRSDRVVATPPKSDGLIQFTMKERNRKLSPQAFMESRLGLKELQHGETANHRGMEGYTAIASAKTPFGTRPVRYVVLFRDENAYIFAGAAKAGDAPYHYDQAVIDTAKSFRTLNKEERALAAEQKIHLLKAGARTTFPALARTSPLNGYREETLRLLNGHYPAGEPTRGEWLKVVE